MAEDKGVLDCIVVGAGPGGLQAAIYLGRYNFDAIVLDRSGGRTRHARHVENYLGIKLSTGAGILDTGVEQAEGFGVPVRRARVTRIINRGTEGFEAETSTGESYRARFVIVSTGAREKLPEIENLYRFFARSFHTCLDCDGYRTRGKKLLVMGNHINTVRLAMAMKKMYTEDLSLLLLMYDPPDDYREELAEQGIRLYKGRPKRLLGSEDGETLEAVELEDGTVIECEAVMSNFGYSLNDDFLDGLEIKRDARGFKIEVNTHFESSVSGLYVVGPLNTGNDQIVIAAGQGAVAAMDIKKRILEMTLGI